MLKKILAAGGLLINEKLEILMIFRNGKWELPKGKIEPGELISKAALREVAEETGIKNHQIIDFITTTEHTYFDKWENQPVEKITYWFLMKTEESNFIPQIVEGIEKVEWTDEEKRKIYLQDSYPNIQHLIEEWSLYTKVG